MGEDEGTFDGIERPTDGGDSGGNSDDAQSSLSVTVGDGDRGVSGGNRGRPGRGGDGSGDSGGGAIRSDRAAARRERSERNKREHAARKKTSSRARTANVKVTERRSRVKQEKASPIPPQALGDLVGVCFEITAQRKGEHWRLGNEEKSAWGDALANCLRHVPMPEKQVGIVADIVALGFVSYATIVPRVNIDRAVLESQRPKAAPEPPPFETREPMEAPVILRPPIG